MAENQRQKRPLLPSMDLMSEAKRMPPHEGRPATDEEVPPSDTQKLHSTATTCLLQSPQHTGLQEPGSVLLMSPQTLSLLPPSTSSPLQQKSSLLAPPPPPPPPASGTTNEPAQHNEVFKETDKDYPSPTEAQRAETQHGQKTDIIHLSARDATPGLQCPAATPQSTARPSSPQRTTSVQHLDDFSLFQQWQTFKARLTTLELQWVDLSHNSHDSRDYGGRLERLNQLVNEFEQLKKQCAELSEECDHLEASEPVVTVMEEVVEDVVQFAVDNSDAIQQFIIQTEDLLDRQRETEEEKEKEVEDEKEKRAQKVLDKEEDGGGEGRVATNSK